jgi:hypothetical protein
LANAISDTPRPQGPRGFEFIGLGLTERRKVRIEKRAAVAEWDKSHPEAAPPGKAPFAFLVTYFKRPPAPEVGM